MLNERDLFLAMSGHTRQVWAEHFLGFPCPASERREWEAYQWLHDQANLHFIDTFPGSWDATPKKVEAQSPAEYRRSIVRALAAGKNVVGARIPVGPGEVCLPLLRPRDDLLDVFYLRNAPRTSKRTDDELAQFGSVKAGAIEDFLKPWAFGINRILLLTPSFRPGNQASQVFFATDDQEIQYERGWFDLARQSLEHAVSDPMVAPEDGFYFPPLDNGLLQDRDRLKAASLLGGSSFRRVCECIGAHKDPTLAGELAARRSEGFLRDVTMITPARCVLARAVEIPGVAIEPDCIRTGVPVLISVAWMEGERVRSTDLTLEEIVTDHPKLSEIKRLTEGGSRTLFIGEKTSLNTGYALLSEQSTDHPFTAFDRNGTVHRLPYAFIDSAYANPSLIASNNSLEEAARLFRLPPPPEPGELPPAVLCSIANSMLEKRSTESDRALLSAAAAYCRWEAVTALGATAEVHARHMLATGTLERHVKKVSGFKNWLTLETERLDLHRFGENSGRPESEAQTKAQAELALF